MKNKTLFHTVTIKNRMPENFIPNKKPLKLLCYFRHNWEIKQTCDRFGRFIEFKRECKRCRNVQYLTKPKKYHPTKYVWLPIQEKLNGKQTEH